MNAGETYNGWQNYPTWCVALWLENDEGLYLETLETVARIAAKTEPTSPYWTLEESHRYNLAEALKVLVTTTQDDGGIMPDLGASFAADLLNYALELVDWDEIARDFLSEVES